jgi:uncharacterized protein (DUF2249 family)
MPELDVREIPPAERHERIHRAFDELEPGEALTIVNDHEPKPLYYEMAAEVPAFDETGYAVEREGDSRFVATFPKEASTGEIDRVSLDDLDDEPHADVFPGKTPKTVRLSLATGECVPAHDHPDRTVLFHLLSGKMDLQLDGETHRVEAGDVVRFGGESEVQPTAVDPSTALIVLAPRTSD